jgi:FkbM family methyltransferase
LFKKILSLLNVLFSDTAIIRKSSLSRLNEALRYHALPSILRECPTDRIETLVEALDNSQSQFLQDLFVLANAESTTAGFFVEFGATDGKELSNSFLLEKYFGWKGLLVEPSRQFHAALLKNRTAKIDLRCVSDYSGRFVDFMEVEGTGLSSVHGRSNRVSAFMAGARGKGKKYQVETISLTDLLREHNAPAMVDYLSIDIEGPEFDVLAGHDWALFKFRLITVEHNFSTNREKIHALLVSHGYKRVHESSSYVDDWYVLLHEGHVRDV